MTRRPEWQGCSLRSLASVHSVGQAEVIHQATDTFCGDSIMKRLSAFTAAAVVLVVVVGLLAWTKSASGEAAIVEKVDLNVPLTLNFFNNNHNKAYNNSKKWKPTTTKRLKSI